MLLESERQPGGGRRSSAALRGSDPRGGFHARIRSRVTQRAHIDAWLAGYERAWRTPGTELLVELFSADATYQQAPYERPLSGLGEIGAMWETEREGPDEPFTMQTELVALDGDVAVVRVQVNYERSTPREYRDLWVIRFAADGRCREFEEWPFWPTRERSY
jgi:hypothetical protein